MSRMVDIPSALLDHVAVRPHARSLWMARPSVFRLDKTPPDFTLTLDRSDATITLESITKAACSVLAMCQPDKSA